jgi:hypothetical protein
MGSDANRLRRKWQDYSGKKAGIAEVSFLQAFQATFEGTEYRIRRSPNEFGKIYLDVELSPQVLAEIHVPEEAVKKHGVVPDYAIDNLETNKTIYVEVKRQDGWIEGGKRADGRGNAHERSCKFFTPGLQKVLRQHGNLGEDILPFWTVFQGDITRDPCRVREIALWYDEYTAHYFLWRNSQNATSLIEHFIQNIKPLLD